MKTLTVETLDRLSHRAAATPRLRLNHNLHERLDDPIQRLCNAFEPGTYVRPHRHPQPGRWELFMILRGRSAVLTFDDAGTVTERIELDADGPVLAAEIPPATWHTVAPLAAGCVLFEVKHGPYQALTDKDFAAWAPREGEPACGGFEAWFRRARAGDTPPA